MYHPDVTELESPSAYGLTDFSKVTLLPYYNITTKINGVEKTVLNTAQNKLAGRKAYGWWGMPPTKPTMAAIYFHGNSQNISTRSKRLKALSDGGFAVLGVSYTGFSKRNTHTISRYSGDYDPDKPTEHMLYEDARAAINFVRAQGFKDSQIILIGESLGTGVATQIATEMSPRAVILDCPFTSVAARSQEIYWWLPAYFMVWDRYDNASKIKKVKAPTLIIGAANDTVVPVHHAKDLAALGGANVHLSVYENMGHVGLPADQFAAIVRAFITYYR